jgi:hypothetical protein|tara:strand:+ start:300 stop:1682 length:1383 start_codon:yes stop_codon:yes gene_type:complete
MQWTDQAPEDRQTYIDHWGQAMAQQRWEEDAYNLGALTDNPQYETTKVQDIAARQAEAYANEAAKWGPEFGQPIPEGYSGPGTTRAQSPINTDPNTLWGAGIPSPSAQTPPGDIGKFNPGWVATHGQSTPSKPSGPVNQFAGDASGNPELWNSPMPGYVQFHPGGAVYSLEVDGQVMPAWWIQQNQHLGEVQDSYVSGGEWADEYGYVDPLAGDKPYIPSSPFSFQTQGPFAPEFALPPEQLAKYGMSSMPSINARAAAYQQGRGATQGAYPYMPSEVAYAKDMRDKKERAMLAERQNRIMQAMGIGGGGLETFDWDNYYANQQAQQQQYYDDQWGIPPVTPVSTYAPPIVVQGEPSFARDPNPLDQNLEVSSVGLERLSIPARTRMNKWLQELGYSPTGTMGTYGETVYQRPTGAEGAVQFSGEDYARLTDPQVRKWIEWLMGEMGHGPSANYPGTVAA